ncbi:MAG: hypothetical protein US76_03300 [Parcubacteria group bacterium GW2011_GWA2_38_13b]|nr:MAG: hypothetical protein US76_03300 [Parcubacteria group bacterium GW2011_GWA2_38_13b]
MVPTVDRMIKNNPAEFTEETLLPAMEKIVDEKIDEKVPEMINKANLKLMDHFDNKIADLRGDVIMLFRKDERRFLHLIDVLYQKNILNQNDIKTIEELQLFPQATK